MKIFRFTLATVVMVWLSCLGLSLTAASHIELPTEYPIIRADDYFDDLNWYAVPPAQHQPTAVEFMEDAPGMDPAVPKAFWDRNRSAPLELAVVLATVVTWIFCP